MQTEQYELYRRVSEKHDIDYEKVKAVGLCVFKELYRQLHDPEKLIIKLKGVGYWYLRRQRMIMYNEVNPPNELFKNSEDEVKRAIYADAIRLRNILIARLEDYEKYLLVKETVNSERRKTQYLIDGTDYDS